MTRKPAAVERVVGVVQHGGDDGQSSEQGGDAERVQPVPGPAGQPGAVPPGLDRDRQRGAEQRGQGPGVGAVVDPGRVGERVVEHGRRRPWRRRSGAEDEQHQPPRRPYRREGR